jgi:LEA14-like dessication related protein
MKRKLLLIAAVLICGLLCTTCSMLMDAAKSAVKMPEVSLKSVDFTKIDFNGLTMLSTLDVKNGNPIDIPLPKINWDLLVVNNPFINGIIQSGGSLKSKGTTQVQFPVSFSYMDLIKAITALTDNNANYKMKMTAHIPIPKLGDLSWPFEFEGKLPLLRIPDISIAAAPSASFTYGSVPGIPTGGKIEFALNLKNNSNIAVMIKDLSYVMQIGNTSLPKAGITGNPSIRPGATEKISFQFPLAVKDITAIGLNVLRGNFNFNLTGNYKFGLPDFPLLNEVGDSFSLRK